MESQDILPQAQQKQALPTGVPPSNRPVSPVTPAAHEVPRSSPDALEQASSQAIVAALAANNAELRALNAQLVASNTALQSVNSELQTLRVEYQRQIHELTHLSITAEHLLHSTEVPMLLLDHNLCLQKFTPAMTAFFPLTEQAIGRPIADLALTIGQIGLLQDIQEVLRTGGRVEKELRTRAGTWLLMRVLPFQDAGGTRLGMVLTCTDITRLKQAEEAVRQFKSQLQNILDYAPAAIYIKDTEGRYLLIDRQFEAMLDATSADILGKTVYDLYPKNIADALAAHDQQVLAANMPLTFEEVGPTLHGPRTYLSIKFPLRDVTGVPYALCGISTDITERKVVEEALYHAKGELEQRVQQLSRLTAILEATTDIVGIADTHERIVYLNAAGRQLLGLGEQEVIGLKVADFFPGWAMQIIREEGVPAARHAGTWTGETALLGRDGREIPVSQVIIAHTSPGGKLESFSTIMRNITEEKHTRDMLRHRAEEMEAFAYSASHDLQAPLRTFEGYARWLLEDYGEMLGDTGRQLCAEIITDALHMKTLLDGLLEYSRIGRHHVAAVVVEVKKVLNRVLHDLQLEISNTGAIIHVPEQLPTVIYPEVRLTQVFSNLLSNALKFIADRVPEIRIDYEELERHYRFRVRDNGIGIAPEHVGRIFEIFRRLHTREAYPGTGVGLTIVKKIVESHGGQIGVESTPGVGSTFWFTLPKPEKLPART
jgi:PAS domain S-box-containing protein